MIEIQSTALITMFERVSFAAFHPGDKEDRRDWMASVNLYLQGDHLQAIATDGHRIARITRPVEVATALGPASLDFTVQLADAERLVDQLRDDPGRYKLWVRESRTAEKRFRLSVQRRGANRVVEYEHHSDFFKENDAAALIPEWTDARSCRCSAAGLLYALQRATVTEVTENRLRYFGVHIHGDGSRLVVSHRDDPNRRLATVVAIGSPLPLRGVSQRYLMEAVAAIDGEYVDLRMREEYGVPIGVAAPDDPAWICVIMPMKLLDQAFPALHRVK